MRRFFGPQGCVSRVTIESSRVICLVIRRCERSMCTFRLGMTDEDCPCLWIVRRLNELGIAHRYEEFPDNHSGVDYRMDESLPFLAEALSA
jgi:hypothetical protein